MNPERELPAVPLGLCGTLVAAAGLLLFPTWAEPPLGSARWLMCLPLRVLPARMVEASAKPSATAEASSAIEARERLAADAVRGGIGEQDAGASPVICRVIERRTPPRRRGSSAASLPDLLVLDRSWDEVADCTGLVTRGGSLVGFLATAGEEAGASARSHAVVRCVHAAPRGAPPRRLLALAEIGGAPLRFVVEPGSHIDAWPLRVALMEDPYRAARLGGADTLVRTCRDTAGGVAIPDGLALGTLRVWGYDDGASPSLPVGLFVEPAFDPRAITTVVLWRTTAGHVPRDDVVAADVVRLPARAVALPPGRRLYLVTGTAQVSPGAAVVGADGQLFGVVEAAGPGDAVASSFAVVGRTWSLLLLPRDPACAPIECAARVVAGAGDHVDVELNAPVAACDGEVLTGGQGLHCPAGLYVGRIVAFDAAARRVRIGFRAPDPHTVSVCVRLEGQP